ncbi:hypothetical protein A2W13_03150 [Candidatus Woesebacteria bacterium RBG_16_36_11]|uniref:dUTP diphosphatase n=3 Tax=Candidatus Woeseibacteriota TaxID=1752722 RepID=A0A1F7XDQ8_9BACT|nr:MAG: hypothetical protein A2Z67_00230 [Candidatus Woesebacteria bacterium RBG_13_36_22]OGM12455.1 MAG: hypothetical protein A2W13_03150 [Candidatus Woesebacteria bacterium RBG_16_36_11]OGM15634.1 MAG: hypothetical protein A2V55_02055 [Candidatus Woesebacteria bacterium RBG_19FT_COMBO_37_29]
MEITKPTLKFKIIKKEGIIPAYAHEDDAGFDLYSTVKVIIKKGKIQTIPLGIASEIPDGFFVSFRDKSGLAAKFGIHVMAGVVDSGYRGEWLVVLVNLGDNDYTVEIGDKIAQGILQKAPKAEIKAVKKLDSSERGSGGFGSTGKK